MAICGAEQLKLSVNSPSMMLDKARISTAASLLSIFLIHGASSLTFNLTSLADSQSEINFQGDAYVNDAAIVLTKDGANLAAVGRATYRDPLLLWDAKTRQLTDFNTHFSFIIRSNESNYADGFAFFLGPYPSDKIPPFSKGGFLGLFSNSTSFKETISTVAVEFDTFTNNEWDPRSEHLGIDVNSIVSSANVTWNGSIRDGRVANAWVSYDARTYNLSLFLTYDKTNLAPAANYSLHYVVDLRNVLPSTVTVGFSAATGNFTETHSILSWSFTSSLQQRKKLPAAIIVGLAIGAASMLALCFLCVILFAKKRKQGRSGTSFVQDMDHDVAIDHELESERGPKRFEFRELAKATSNFLEERKLGEGGFGSVYRGFLNDLNLDVAIKRISKGSKQGKKEYISEVKAISRLRHRNLVQLVGWCHHNMEFLLVYEFMPNGSLDSYLYSKTKFLHWPERYKIALGLASALFYLHEEGEQYVVHRDIKPSNVMLDSAFNAKLGDFGLARLVDHDHDLQTTDLAGTRAYMAPECFYTGKASKESDVYSFGIVALEIACGRRAIEPCMEQAGKGRLDEWVWELYGRGKILDAVDERLQIEKIDERQIESMMVVGLWCAHPDYKIRPSIKQVIAALSFEAPLPILPSKKPVPIYDTQPQNFFDCWITSSATSSEPSNKFAHSFVMSLSPSYLVQAS